MGKIRVYDMRVISEEEYKDFVRSEVQEWREYAKLTIEKVETIASSQAQLLCYFSLIECLAQDVANYPDRGQQKIFTDFVLKYQNKYDYLNEVDPVTLFYHAEKNYSGLLSIKDFQEGEICHPTDAFIREKASNFIATLTATIGEENANKFVLKHRYVDLLYRMRCRLSHEFSLSHIGHIRHQEEPYYISCYRSYLKDGKIIEDDVWMLSIPVSFVKNICINCVDNYLDECVKNNVLPVDNNSMDRFCELSWYR